MQWCQQCKHWIRHIVTAIVVCRRTFTQSTSSSHSHQPAGARVRRTVQGRREEAKTRTSRSRTDPNTSWRRRTIDITSDDIWVLPSSSSPGPMLTSPSAATSRNQLLTNNRPMNKTHNLWKSPSPCVFVLKCIQSLILSYSYSLHNCTVVLLLIVSCMKCTSQQTHVSFLNFPVCAASKRHWISVCNSIVILYIRYTCFASRPRLYMSDCMATSWLPSTIRYWHNDWGNYTYLACICSIRLCSCMHRLMNVLLESRVVTNSWCRTLQHVP